MVFFFTCKDKRYVVYMGKDKFENEELLKYGFPEDVWFHVDKLSSAHVYLRMPAPEGVTTRDVLAEMLKAIPEDVITEMAQLVKANSIEGCKKSEVDIVYTPFHNLDKRIDMDTGTVGFKDIKKENEIVKRIEKTREEKQPELKIEKEQRMEEEKQKNRKAIAQRKEAEKQAAKEAEEKRKLQSYDSLFQNAEENKPPQVDGSIEQCRAAEEDFM